MTKKDHLFAEMEGGEIHGFILIKDGEGDFMWLDVLTVNRRFKGKGLGRKLIHFGEEHIKNSGKSRCRLFTHVKYERTIGIYQNLGYKIYDRVQENGHDRYCLEKNLKGPAD